MPSIELREELIALLVHDVIVVFCKCVNVLYKQTVLLRELWLIGVWTRSDEVCAISQAEEGFKNGVLFEISSVWKSQAVLCLELGVDEDLFLNELFFLAKFHFTDVLRLVFYVL